jgi:hypothetical protein
MATVSAPVRHGKCSLRLSINGIVYRLRRLPAGPHSRVWLLTKPDGTEYTVTRSLGVVNCTCPDARMRSSRCKHLRALVALGLVSGRPRVPSAVAALASGAILAAGLVALVIAWSAWIGSYPLGHQAGGCGLALLATVLGCYTAQDDRDGADPRCPRCGSPVNVEWRGPEIYTVCYTCDYRESWSEADDAMWDLGPDEGPSHVPGEEPEWHPLFPGGRLAWSYEQVSHRSPN